MALGEPGRVEHRPKKGKKLSSSRTNPRSDEEVERARGLRRRNAHWTGGATKRIEGAIRQMQGHLKKAKNPQGPMRVRYPGKRLAERKENSKQGQKR